MTDPCHCFEINEKFFKENYDKIDYIIIGESADHNQFNLKIDSMTNDYLSSPNTVKIDSAIKGNPNSEHLLIAQFDITNCNFNFEVGKQYLILGLNIDSFEKGERIPEGIEIAITEYDWETEIMQIRNSSTKYIDLWNGLTSSNIVVMSNKCGIFELSDINAKRILNYTAHQSLKRNGY